MKRIAAILSCLALGLTLIPSFLVASQILSFKVYTQLMLIGTLIWFIAAPYWIRPKTR